MKPRPARAAIRLAIDQDLEPIHALEHDAAARFSAAGFVDLAAPSVWPDLAARRVFMARPLEGRGAGSDVA